MSKKTFYILLSVCIIMPALAQKWVNAGIPISAAQVRMVTSDTINNKMYVGGFIPFDTNGNIAICIYDGVSWVVKDTIDNIVRSMVIYNNELYMGGDFVAINSQSMEHLVKWNGTNWVNIGASGGNVLNLRVINNDLYAVGTFTQVAGINANSIAKWNGTSWSSVNFPASYFLGNNSFVGDCVIYNGELYAGGNFHISTGQTDIAVLKNGTWQRVGNSDSLKGAFSSINKLEVFHNELYIGGYILHSEGNVGNGIQRWDGVNWKTVGTGLQDYNNTTNSGTSVLDMMQYKNKLYVAGGFSFAGNSIAPNLATWDGTKWCAIDTLIDKRITAFGIFQDTIYVGTNDIFEGNFINSFGKFTVGNYSYTEECSSDFDVSINELLIENQISIYPNPTTSFLNIVDKDNQLQNATIQIKNYLGQIVLSSPFTSQINLQNISAGMYFLTVKDKDYLKTFKIIRE
jgi:hypothetical protein